MSAPIISRPSQRARLVRFILVAIGVPALFGALHVVSSATQSSDSRPAGCSRSIRRCWPNAQEELLQALRVGQAGLIEASRERLRLLGVDAEQVRVLERSRKAGSRIAVRAPQAGVVTELNVRDGMYVTPDTIVMSFADLSSVWLQADVFERQAAWVAVGQTAEMRLPYRPGEVFTGAVEFIYPSLDPKTRTLRARLRFDNPGETLKPGMYANVQIFAGPQDDVLSVPQQALIRSGRTDRVILALGEGRFRAVDVVAGMESGDWIEIREGVQDGDQVSS